MQKAFDTRNPGQDKILIVCGPTASGKTSLAISLAKQYNGELINADSRQMYQGMDVLSGKDIPAGGKSTQRGKLSVKDTELLICTYDLNGIPIWLYDMAPVSTSLSISHFQAAAEYAISDIHARGKIPIIVGGNGFYLSSLVRAIPTISVPQNPAVRSSLEGKSLSILQNTLASLDAMRLHDMNNSDRNNPRRLLRAIEVAVWKKDKAIQRDMSIPMYDAFWVGIRMDVSVLESRITERVSHRFEGGAIGEAKAVGNVAPELPAGSILGLSMLQAYIRGERSAEETQHLWSHEEFRYAKRQMVWFAKQTEIHWFDGENNRMGAEVEKLVREWYTYR